jgi:hypothetical protein
MKNRILLCALLALLSSCEMRTRVTVNTKARAAWQRISPNSFRARTPVGWLIEYSSETGSGVCYVPDAKHEWVLVK